MASEWVPDFPFVGGTEEDIVFEGNPWAEHTKDFILDSRSVRTHYKSCVHRPHATRYLCKCGWARRTVSQPVVDVSEWKNNFLVWQLENPEDGGGETRDEDWVTPARSVPPTSVEAPPPPQDP